ncbi:MAG TPA: RsmD family RNA methyltransferase, partial [Anaeromyxobacteraceae bacterium]|nr:RsmD family RNA methyltransferase [Anaeromyxobacteraceae bacterium]
MRIVAGEAKGRRLAAPPGADTRPTSDKVRAAIFNVLGQFFEEGRV